MDAARGTQRKGAWPYWREPLPLRVYVAVVVASAVVLAAWLSQREQITALQFGLFALLLGCGALVSATSRTFLRGVATDFRQDLNSCWKLPILLLLPPFFAAVAPLFFTIFRQTSVRKQSHRYRQVFTLSTLSLGDAAASLLFHRLVTADTPILAWFAAGLLAAVVARLCNVVFIGMVVWLTQPEALPKLLDREALLYMGVEISVGLLIAVAALQSPPLAVLGIPPVILLHRSLLHEQLRTASRTDPKTEVLNAGAWEFDAQQELARSAGRQSTSVLICDIDHFKRVNDKWGHLAGDAALRAVAQRLQAQLRKSDILGRFGGEEFVILLPGTDTVDAKAIAERLRRSVAQDPIALDTVSMTLTVSLGVATLHSSESKLSDGLAAADRALYTAKNRGRDRVVIARRLRPAGDVPVDELTDDMSAEEVVPEVVPEGLHEEMAGEATRDAGTAERDGHVDGEAVTEVLPPLREKADHRTHSG